MGNLKNRIESTFKQLVKIWCVNTQVTKKFRMPHSGGIGIGEYYFGLWFSKSLLLVVPYRNTWKGWGMSGYSSFSLTLKAQFHFCLNVMSVSIINWYYVSIKAVETLVYDKVWVSEQIHSNINVLILRTRYEDNKWVIILLYCNSLFYVVKNSNTV